MVADQGHHDRGVASLAAGLGVLNQLHAGTPYVDILGGLIMIGAGMGTSFVSLTTAALHGVAPVDAGAAPGLINVTQQLGAALGLAGLVTVFDSVTGAGRGTARSGLATSLVHGIDVTFAARVAFALAAWAIGVFVVRAPSAEVDSGLDSEVGSLGSVAGCPGPARWRQRPPKPTGLSMLFARECDGSAAR
jgi:hypothetical protein